MAQGSFNVRRRFHFGGLSIKTRLKPLFWLVIALSGVLNASCGHKTEPKVQASSPTLPIAVTTKSNEIPKPATPLTELVTQLLTKAQQSSLSLRQQMAALLANPNMDTLTATQNAWDEAAKSIEVLTVFSYLPGSSMSTRKFQYNLSAWPIAPGYLDTYGEDAYSGLVFEVGTPLTVDLLRQQHGFSSTRDATLGIYAIEFILFGEDNERGPLLFVPITSMNEQHIKAGYKEISELPRNRRRQLLQLQTETLNVDIDHYQQFWQTLKPGIDDNDFMLAAIAMVEKQRGEVAELRSPTANALFQNQVKRGAQLASRFVAQLPGLQEGLSISTIPNKKDISTRIETVFVEVQKISSAASALGPKAAPTSQTLEVWTAIDGHLKELATALSSTIEK